MTTTTTVAAGDVIRVEGLRKVYGDLVAVDGISFEVQPGRGLRPARSQRRRQDDDGRGPRGPPEARWRVGRRFSASTSSATPHQLKSRIGVSLQNAALYPKLTVIELLDLFGTFYP